MKRTSQNKWQREELEKLYYLKITGKTAEEIGRIFNICQARVYELYNRILRIHNRERPSWQDK